jgi:hypothetical protein
MQLMAGNLADLLHNSGKKLTWSEKLGMAEEIALGVLYLHSANPEVQKGTAGEERRKSNINFSF